MKMLGNYSLAFDPDLNSSYLCIDDNPVVKVFFCFIMLELTNGAQFTDTFSLSQN